MLQLSQRPLLATAADAALFVDREPELTKLRRAVELGLNTLLLGERGSGKTSLVHQLERTLEADGTAVDFVDAGSTPDPAALMDAISGDVPEGGGRAVVLVDGAPPEVAHGLFGRLRDEVWQLPLTWVVTGDAAKRAAYLEPPADAFFDSVVVLDDLPLEAAETLLLRRIDGAGPGDDAEAGVLRDLASALAESTRPRTPRQLLAAARDVLLADDPAKTVDAAGVRQRRAAALGRPHAVLLAELEALGPSSASDPELLDRLGWTRARAVQVLRDLEREGLVTATVDRSGTGPGRPPKLYGVVTR